MSITTKTISGWKRYLTGQWFRISFDADAVDGLGRRYPTVLQLIVCSDLLPLKTPA